jgi:hypothetical protein
MDLPPLPVFWPVYWNVKRKCWKICTEAWPQYTLGDQEKWPSQGSLNYNTILQLDLFCKREEKVNWGPLYKFSFISETTQIGSKFAIQVLKCWPFLVSHKINMGKEDHKCPLSVTRPPPLLLHPLPYLLSHPNIQNLLMGASPFNRQW